MTDNITWFQAQPRNGREAVLILPASMPIAQAQQFCEANLLGCVAGVCAEVNAAGLGEMIAQAFATGSARALLHGLVSSKLNALPAAFPINNARRLAAAHAVLLALDGLPGVHLHHFSPTNELGAAHLNKTFESLAKPLRTRAAHEAFTPGARQQRVELPDEVFGLMRWVAPVEGSPLMMQRGRVVCLVNVSAEEQLVSLDWRALLGTRNAIRDLISGVRFNVHGPSLELQPYQVLWATL